MSAAHLRLRVEHEKLRSELFGRQLLSELVEAIRVAVADQSGDSDLQRMAARLDKLDSIAPKVELIAKEIDFIADQATAEFGERKMQPPALAKIKSLGGIVSSAIVKNVIHAIWEKLAGK